MVASAMLLPPLQVQSVTLDGIVSALYVSNYRFISSGVEYFGKQDVLARRPSSTTGRWVWRSSSTFFGRC